MGTFSVLKKVYVIYKKEQLKTMQAYNYERNTVGRPSEIQI